MQRKQKQAPNLQVPVIDQLILMYSHIFLAQYLPSGVFPKYQLLMKQNTSVPGIKFVILKTRLFFVRSKK